MSHLKHINLPLEREHPFLLPWPAEKAGVAFLTFTTPEEWRSFVHTFDLRPGVPMIVAAKYQRAQKLYYLSWIDFDIIKAGELIALTALELALTDRYGKKDFSALLKHMVTNDGLTDDKVPLVRRAGGSAVKRMTGVVPSLPTKGAKHLRVIVV